MTKRFYVFTGKGGVGKTTLSMSFALALKNRGKNVRYHSFYQSPKMGLLTRLGIPFLDISISGSAEKYIAKKLGSKTLATWIMSTHFFKSLFQMVPGLGHMILLGDLINECNQNPDLILVIDSPASGHALTMFESSQNFKRIFKSGPIVEDIEKMKEKMQDKSFLKTFIITLPNDMAYTEALEVAAELKDYPHYEIIKNRSLIDYISSLPLSTEELPTFIKTKLEIEKNIPQLNKTLPFLPCNEEEKIIQDLSLRMEEFE